jgi:DnaJ-class molecular chaperone
MAALVPEDDLYGPEVAVDASPEAIELTWRALLKRHHPTSRATPRRLERAKRINVAHDWLSDSGLRARYDRAP